MVIQLDKKIAVQKVNSINMKFRLIPTGDFFMGSPEDEEGSYDNERPMHKVSISKPFYLGIYPVTQLEWKAIMGETDSDWLGDNRPVNNVLRGDVKTFISRLIKKEGGMNIYRLPSEAEWEYACRAGTNTRYCFGDNESELGEYAWYDDAKNNTRPIGKKKPNSWGIYDMHGNVSEWVDDTWHENYYGAPIDGSAWKTHNSVGVIRGGSWWHRAENCRSAIRKKLETDTCNNNLGFRLLMEL